MKLEEINGSFYIYFLFFLFGGIMVWSQGLKLARQAALSLDP
jgi:hypothetical protein